MRAFWEREAALKQACAAAAAALLVVVGVAWASDQTASSLQGRQEHFSPRPGSAISELSPGNRLIAEALFAAQSPDAAGQASWSLARIAASRGAGLSWGEVFQQMKDENLLRAQTLGQAVTWYQYNYLKPEPYAAQGPLATTPASEKSYGN
jgi:hypothetical protein